MLDSIDIKYFKIAVGQDALGKESPIDITARCPICGDSQKKKSSKRLHLYIKNGVTNINCFNGDCPCQNKSVYGFIKDFYPNLLSQYKREQFGNTINKINNYGSEDVFAELSETKKSEIQTLDLSQYLRKITDAPEALEYLKNRGFEYNLNYGNWYFGYQDLQIGETLYKITNAIVIPLYYNGEMYGFYSRNIYNKTFYTYMHDANIGYKVWNWFNIDKNKPVYIFEGIFDAMASGIPNVIAAIGAKIPDERIAELKDPIFCYDNDKTGLLNALNMAKRGHKVFIQPTPIKEKDMNEVMLNHPEMNLQDFINFNVYTGINAEIRIKAKL